MKLHFDPSEPHQLEAIQAATNLFSGQPIQKSNFEIGITAPKGQLQFNDISIIGNNLEISPEIILQNLQKVQETYNENNTPNELEISKELMGLNFSIEMETGTGKTYVYLRTIYELHQQYGFKKFIIVVPSLAIKEGVLKNLQITGEHFATLYNNPEMDFHVYDPKKRGMLKNFATTNSLQILVINIDSFAKFSAKKNGTNIIYKESDWGVPIEFIQNTQPIVIVDEPQNMETDIRKQAIQNLNPLFTLRYSATHKNPYNLIYKLDPVQAYDAGLVKKIEVDSVLADTNVSQGYIAVKGTAAQKKRVTAKLEIEAVTKTGVAKKKVTVKVGDNLYELSQEHTPYKSGYIINEIDVENGCITLSSGETLFVGQNTGGISDELIKFQIKKTIQNHLDKELRLQEQKIKVLSLFFIDKVANYRTYEGSVTKKGKCALWFEESLNEVLQNPKYDSLDFQDIEKVHNGYFAQDKKGILKDTKGNTQADDDVYTLIMKDKERLLSLDEPLRFIFSHSALREGWDNPNVFQICTLNESRSELKKRQEIGRGMRLPVNNNGERVFDESINVLTVTANESYEQFAKSLQTEIEEDFGVAFEGRIKDKNKKKKITLKKGYELDENFRDLWDKIKYKTQYHVAYETNELITIAAKKLSQITISPIKLTSFKARLKMSEKGVETQLTSIKEQVATQGQFFPDVLGYIQRKTKLTRSTIIEIIKQSGKAEDIVVNTQQFMDDTVHIIDETLKELMVDGIKYEKIAGKTWSMTLFENKELEGYLDSLFSVSKPEKTAYNYIQCDSDIETTFAKDLEANENVLFYVKLPSWFTINTPIGSYNPDWAVVYEGDTKVYFIAETKGTDDIEKLSPSEKLKILCGRKHYQEFEDVEYKGPVTSFQKAMAK